MTQEELKNYTPKGQLKGFPKEIIARMLECQEEQRNTRDISLFEGCRVIGFAWVDTKEKQNFWREVIMDKNFDLFFEKYPKQQETKVCSECKLSNKELAQ